MFKFLFFFTYPPPKLGSKYISKNDPWGTVTYQVVDIRKNFVRLKTDYGSYHATTRAALLAFYKPLA